MTPGQREHADAFGAWLRNPKSAALQARLWDVERKNASGASDAAGGFLVPEILVRDIERRVRNENPLRQFARVLPVGSADVKLPMTNNDAGTSWAGENDTRNATAEPTGRQATPTFGSIYAYVTASEELVNDAIFPIAEWFGQSVADAMAEAEADAFVSGNGTKKPTGFLNAAPVATGDADSPARAAGVLQYVPTGAAYSTAAPFGELSTASPAFHPSDAFVDLVYSLRSQYRRNAAWFMSSATTGAVRKLKDADGRPLWTDSMAAGQPPLLLGFPVVTLEAMPAVGVNAHPIAFGDMARAYSICDVGGLRVTMDEVTMPGFVRWHIRRRLGGCVVNDDALKVLKLAAS